MNLSYYIAILDFWSDYNYRIVDLAHIISYHGDSYKQKISELNLVQSIHNM